MTDILVMLNMTYMGDHIYYQFKYVDPSLNYSEMAMYLKVDLKFITGVKSKVTQTIEYPVRAMVPHRAADWDIDEKIPEFLALAKKNQLILMIY